MVGTTKAASITQRLRTHIDYTTTTCVIHTRIFFFSYTGCCFILYRESSVVSVTFGGTVFIACPWRENIYIFAHEGGGQDKKQTHLLY